MSNQYADRILEMRRNVANLSNEEVDWLHRIMTNAQAGRPLSSADKARLDLMKEYVTRSPGSRLSHPYNQPHSLPREPLNAHSEVIDTNIRYGRNKVDDYAADSTARVPSDHDRHLADYHDQMAGRDVRLTDVSVGELGGAHNAVPHKGLSITVERSSEEYQRVKRVLERYRVGKNKGAADREIVGDVFFAATNPSGLIPRFHTDDQDIVRGLLRINGIKPTGPVLTQPFDVTINGKTIHVVPID